MKGALDGGLDIPHNEKRFVGYADKKLDPETLRKYIYGGHVAEYQETMQVSSNAFCPAVFWHQVMTHSSLGRLLPHFSISVHCKSRLRTTQFFPLLLFLCTLYTPGLSWVPGSCFAAAAAKPPLLSVPSFVLPAGTSSLCCCLSASLQAAWSSGSRSVKSYSDAPSGHFTSTPLQAAWSSGSQSVKSYSDAPSGHFTFTPL